ncbi:hypothetical protein KBC03_07000 [Patescibacteria group bacterium]|nr:hypothetical protein [Patescibacteria group bacterium]
MQLVSRKIESTKEIEGKYETKIDVKADIFPVLLHEMAKGVMEYIAYTRYNGMETAEVQSILSVDSRHSEHWMMLI